MARRYHIDELLVLRASPLVTKPDKLPPIEEWMGPIPDPVTQRKPTNSRDNNNQIETTPNRRPSLFETRHVSRGSNSEDIILGPPKTAFASASRIYGKSSSIDSTDRSRFKDIDDVKNDRYNFREKFFKDKENGERDADRRDTRLGATNGRRGGREDREEWNNGRPRRTFGQDDQERRPKRNGEVDRWDNRDRERDQQDIGFERGNKDKDGRFISRRDGQGRGRHEQSWFRDDAGQEAQNIDDDRPSARNRDWRRDRQGADREWNRGARFEQDPEWMDATDRDEPRQAHTQEDFQRWKERMKAGSAQPQQNQPPEEKNAIPEQAPEGARKTESRPAEGELFSNVSTPFNADTGLEKFFGLLGDTKATQDPGTPGPTESAAKKESLSIKGGKSSRFAGLFSPSAENANREPETLNRPARPNSTDADQEGFQRILQMLGSSKSRNTTPQVDGSQQPRPAPLPAEVSRSSTTLSSPAREPTNRPDYMGYQDARNRNSAGLESLLPQSSPKESQASIRDRENLLRLMQQVRLSPASGQAQGNLQSPTTGPTPGILHVPDLLSRPQGMQKPQRTPSFLDDPAIAEMSRPGADPNEQLRRRPTNGIQMGHMEGMTRQRPTSAIQMGYMEEMPFPAVPQGPQTPGERIPQSHGQPPMVLQRPPGFEQMPIPGWGNQPPQSGGPGPLAPPPGIPAPSRGMNPNFLAGPMPIPGNIPPPHERQPFPRGPPPGMMPPPGYMNINGLPTSAFPPMPHTPEAMMGLPHSGQGPVGAGIAGPQGPPPSSRHLLEMFGQTNGADIRGGMMGPGPFR
ncbi:hypothetical protein DTO282E5_8601 [Paecilomyces variotii]|nr:hypothetical protein DTO282E5_8601 [Paecilomyces variotii]